MSVNIGPKENLIGQRFNRLTVIKLYDKSSSGWRWLCKCDCGKETIGIGAKMKCGLKKSCGCYKTENVKPKYGIEHHGWTGYGKLSGSQWRSILSSASIRGIKVDLTIQEAWELFEKQKGRCALSGVELSFGVDNISIRKQNRTASLDRIDPVKPYTLDNVQWVHKDVNYMKIWFGQNEFVNWCKKIVSFTSTRKNT